MAERFYALLWTLLWPALLLWARRQDPPRWRERLGHGAPDFAERPIWMHAASVGEARAAGLLMEAMREQGVTAPFFVTTTTRTGGEAITPFLGPDDRHRYAPLDRPACVRRVLEKIRPAALVVMEVEIWPALWQQCEAAGITIVLANARLSEASAARYRSWLPAFWKRTLNRATLILAQSEAIAARFAGLGVAEERIRVCGNLKYSLRIDDSVRALGKHLRELTGKRPVWLAASTHEGEEEIALEVQQTLQRQIPDLLLVLVPRHPQRFDRVAALCARSGLSMQRRSDDPERAVDEQVAVYLGDTLGELLAWYCAADCCWVAGSFAGVGGHNPIEPALCGCPMVLGPDMGNFAEITAVLLEAGAASRGASPAELALGIGNLLAWPDAARERAERARVCCETLGRAASEQAAAVASALVRSR